MSNIRSIVKVRVFTVGAANGMSNTHNAVVQKLRNLYFFGGPGKELGHDNVSEARWESSQSGTSNEPRC